MDTRSKKLVEFLTKLQTMIANGDICAPCSKDCEPVEITISTKSAGQVAKFIMRQINIEQWKDVDLSGSEQKRLKIIGDIIALEQAGKPQEG